MEYFIKDYVELIDCMLGDESLSYLGSGVTRPASVLSHEDLVRHLTYLVDGLAKRPGADGESVLVKLGPGPLDDVTLMMRWSRAHRDASVNPYSSVWYESIDVVQIGWAPQWIMGDAERYSTRPRGLATPLWNALKEICERKGRALFVESVDMHATRLHEHLVRDHGFTQLPYANFIWIPKTAHPVGLRELI